MSTTSEPQIVELYRKGCTPDVIAQALGKPVDYVKVVLYEDVPAFRKEMPVVPPGTPLHEEMLQLIASVARHTDNVFAQLAAAKYVRDDQLGRLDKQVEQVGDVQALAAINQRLDALAAARPKFERPKHVVDAQVIS